ncbi:MAG: DNA primase [Anaerorhabdus sp.]
MKISQEDINAIRSQSDVVDVIGNYLPLVKKGKSFKAVCPFHDDHDPSLSINQSKQIYKCFVCGAGGNVFTFVQNFEKLSFPESVVKVAEMIDYKLDVKSSDFIIPIDPKKAAAHKVLNEAINYMVYNLNSSDGLIYKEYLNKRGINESLIKMFDIGFNGGDNQLYKFLIAKGYEESIMDSTNLIRISEFGVKDTFANRITFPIHDTYGNPVGFTARTIDPNISSKYINTNETKLYSKGHIVYNYHRAKDYIRKEKAVIVVEGVTDVIAFSKCDIFNVCATLGTAGTKDQLKILRKTTLNIIFCYDGDKAGKNATYKVGKIAQELGFKVFVVKNDDSLDPDEIIERFGKDELKSKVSKPLLFIEFIFDYFIEGKDLTNYSDKKEIAKNIRKEIGLLDSDIDVNYFTNLLEEKTGFKFNDANIKEHPRPQTILRRNIYLNKNVSGIEDAEQIVISQMSLDKRAVEIFQKKLYNFESQKNTDLMKIIFDEYTLNKKFEYSAIIDKLNQDQRNYYTDIMENTKFPEKYDEEQLLGAINKILLHIKKKELIVLRDSLCIEYTDEKMKKFIKLKEEIEVLTNEN